MSTIGEVWLSVIQWISGVFESYIGNRALVAATAILIGLAVFVLLLRLMRLAFSATHKRIRERGISGLQEIRIRGRRIADKESLTKASIALAKGFRFILTASLCGLLAWTAAAVIPGYDSSSLIGLIRGAYLTSIASILLIGGMRGLRSIVDSLIKRIDKADIRIPPLKYKTFVILSA